MEYLLIEKKAWLEMQAGAKRLNERMKKTEQYFFRQEIRDESTMPRSACDWIFPNEPCNTTATAGFCPIPQ